MLRFAFASFRGVLADLSDIVYGRRIRSLGRDYSAVDICFPFQLQKSIQAMAYLVRALKSVDKVALMKLLYYADRNHFIAAGYPITGDTQKALPWGPVPSDSLDALDGEYWPDLDVATKHLSIDNNVVTVRDDPGTDRLNGEEIATLDKVIQEHGSKNKWVLVHETHQLPEYKDAKAIGIPSVIPYEHLLRIYGGADKFHDDRPVVSRAMRKHMISPFPAGSDADL